MERRDPRSDRELFPDITADQWSRSESLVNIPDVQARIDQACDSLGDQMAWFLREHVTATALENVAFESPLEIIFYAWFEAFEASWAHAMWRNVRGPKIGLRAQHWVEVEDQRFRLDFMVFVYARNDDDERFRDTLFPKISIELDGHDFHEKTKEQVTKRNQRDRLLQQAGWRVFHVSGSELARRPLEVVSEIHAHCRDEYENFQFKVYEAKKE